MERIIHFLKKDVLNSDKDYTYVGFVNEFNSIMEKEEYMKRIDEAILKLCRESLDTILKKRRLLKDAKKKPAREKIEVFRSSMSTLISEEESIDSKIESLIKSDFDYIIRFINYVKKISQIHPKIEDILRQRLKKDLSGIYDELNKEESEDKFIRDQLSLLERSVADERLLLSHLNNQELQKKNIIRILDDLLLLYDQQADTIRKIQSREDKKIKLIDEIIKSLNYEKKDIEKQSYRQAVYLPDMNPLSMKKEFDDMLKKYAPASIAQQTFATHSADMLATKQKNPFLIGYIESLESEKTEIKKEMLRNFAINSRVLIRKDLSENPLLNLIAYAAMLIYEKNNLAWYSLAERRPHSSKADSFRVPYLIIAFRMSRLKDQKGISAEFEKALRENLI